LRPLLYPATKNHAQPEVDTIKKVSQIDSV